MLASFHSAGISLFKVFMNGCAHEKLKQIYVFLIANLKRNLKWYKVNLFINNNIKNIIIY